MAGGSGCAALARAGQRVILTEETDWIGGQLTAQAVPPDEHPWIESFGCTRLYRRFRTGVRDYYRRHYALTAEARAIDDFNPGNGLVSRLCHEPRVGLAVLCELFAPHISGRRILFLTRHHPVAADVDGDRVRAVHMRDVDGGRDITLSAPYFLDATELGELLPLTKTEYVVGAEAQRETGEPHASLEATPANQQAFSCCFAMDFVKGEDHTIDKPAEYDFWRAYVPALKPAWPGKLLSWQMTEPISLRERKVSFDPTGPGQGGMNLWLYRRIADQKNFKPGTYHGDMSLVNWPQNDYWLGNLIDVSPGEGTVASETFLELVAAPLDADRGPATRWRAGWRGLRLREDVVGTADGLAKYPYIREARRIKAEFTVLEQHVGTDARMQATGQKRDEVTAQRFSDTVGIGSYRIDLHLKTGGNNYIDVSSLPFQIPLGALIPRRMENLLPACKNLGVTHITNGCYRLHPVEWNIGEAAGALAAFCLYKQKSPRQVLKNKTLLADFQSRLKRDGFELEWPKVSPR